MNTKFDFKILAFRLLTGAYTGFLAGFSKVYTEGHDLNASVQAGLVGLVAALFVAFGVDQLMFDTAKRTEAKPNPPTQP